MAYWGWSHAVVFRRFRPSRVAVWARVCGLIALGLMLSGVGIRGTLGVGPRHAGLGCGALAVLRSLGRVGSIGAPLFRVPRPRSGPFRPSAQSRGMFGSLGLDGRRVSMVPFLPRRVGRCARAAVKVCGLLVPALGLGPLFLPRWLRGTLACVLLPQRLTVLLPPRIGPQFPAFSSSWRLGCYGSLCGLMLGAGCLMRVPCQRISAHSVKFTRSGWHAGSSAWAAFGLRHSALRTVGAAHVDAVAHRPSRAAQCRCLVYSA